MAALENPFTKKYWKKRGSFIEDPFGVKRAKESSDKAYKTVENYMQTSRPTYTPPTQSDEILNMAQSKYNSAVNPLLNESDMNLYKKEDMGFLNQNDMNLYKAGDMGFLKKEDMNLLKEGDMAGYQRSIDRIGSRTAGQVGNIKEMAGSSGQAINAAMGAYSNEAEQLSDIEAKNAEFIQNTVEKNADIMRNMNITNSGLTRQMNMGNADILRGMNETNAGLTRQMGMGNADIMRNMNMTNAQYISDEKAKRQSDYMNALKMKADYTDAAWKYNQADKYDEWGNYLAGKAAGKNADAAQAQQNKSNFWNNIINTAGTAIGAYLGAKK